MTSRTKGNVPLFSTYFPVVANYATPCIERAREKLLAQRTTLQHCVDGFAGHVRLLLANEVAAIIATMFLPRAWPLDFTPSVSAAGRHYSVFQAQTNGRENNACSIPRSQWNGWREVVRSRNIVIPRGHVTIASYYFQLRDYHTPKQIYAAMNALNAFPSPTPRQLRELFAFRGIRLPRFSSLLAIDTLLRISFERRVDN